MSVINTIPADFHARLVGLDPEAQGKKPSSSVKSSVEDPSRLKSDEILTLLLKGDWRNAGNYPSQSEADESLVSRLAQKFGPNRELINQVFRSSGLMRAKWDCRRGEKTYGEMTIDKVMSGLQAKAETTRRIKTIWGDDAPLEEIEWLVPQFTPASPEMTAFTGEMDSRKSTTSLDIAAAGSSQRRWFTGAENKEDPFGTLICASEDSFNRVILPRFIAAGGDRRRLGFLSQQVETEQVTPEGIITYKTALNFDDHLNLIGEEVTAANRAGKNIRLWIADPLIAHFGDTNANNPQESRVLLGKMRQFNEEFRLAGISLLHFNKTMGLNAKQKSGGSAAIVEQHRMAWAFALEEDDKSLTNIMPVKKNLLKTAASYQITTDDTPVTWEAGGKKFSYGHPVIRFLRMTDKNVDDELGRKESKERGQGRDIKAAIVDELKSGRKSPGEVINALLSMGGARTIRRYAAELVKEGKLTKLGEGVNPDWWELTPDTPLLDPTSF